MDFFNNLIENTAILFSCKEIKDYFSLRVFTDVDQAIDI